MMSSNSKSGMEVKNPRENWAEEVIAAAMKTSHFPEEEFDDDNKTDNEDDEGIVSDESPSASSSSSNDETLIHHPQSAADSKNDATSKVLTKMAATAKREKQTRSLKSKSTMYLNEDPFQTPQGNILRFLRSLVLSKNQNGAMRNAKSRVFGKDLKQHLAETKQEIPPLLRVCSKCIEHRGIVDGIYRLSGISSNIRALKLAFEVSVANNRRYDEVDVTFPIEVADPNVRQDVHSVSSLLKLYFRELPDPLCTYKLYEDFLAAAKVPEDLRLSAMRQVVKNLPKENARTLEYLMRHLFKVSLKGNETGMTAKNLAIVWAPNLLRNKDLKNHNNNNLKDIALQAVCTEFLIKFCDLLFASHFPSAVASLEQSFELGILEGGRESREIDIDGEILKRAPRPKSVAISPSAFKEPQHSTVQLKRSTSSILASSSCPAPARQDFNLSRFLVSNKRKLTDQQPVLKYHSSDLLRSKSGDNLLNQQQPFKKRDQTRRKAVSTFAVNHLKNNTRPHSSSSEASETDVAGEVNHLHLSFEQEENEMKMMSCIFDDEEVSTSSSSNSSAIGQSHEDCKKMTTTLKAKFIKNKKENGGGQKVQRSASAIIRSKMYAVVSKKRKMSKPASPTANNDGPRGSRNEQDPGCKKMEEESILKGVTFTNLDPKNESNMECIPEEALAFENKAYLSLQFPASATVTAAAVDSGFESYEDVKSKNMYENVENLKEDLEKIPDEDESYENIEPPPNYQNIDFTPPLIPPPNYQEEPSEPTETYENLKFNSLIETHEETYQNIQFAEKTPKATPVYATLKKGPLNGAPLVDPEGVEDDSPVYENYDFQEEAIYQNMVVKRAVGSGSGKLIPANASARRQSVPARPSTSEVYAQVKLLRRSVQEVNAMLEQQPKRSELIRQRTKELEINNSTSHFTRSSNTASVKRSSNFKSILNKFNVMATSSEPETAPASNQRLMKN